MRLSAEHLGPPAGPHPPRPGDRGGTRDGRDWVRRVRRLVPATRSPLYANAYALLANQLSSAVLGFVYWLLAARLYPVEVVGRSAAVISLLLLIASFSQLGLDAGMVRFVPRAGRHARRLILSAYVVVPACAALLSAAMLWMADLLRFAGTIAGGGVPSWLLVLATVCWSVFYFQDGILNGLRQSVWVFAENLLYNVVKIALLVAGVGLLGEAGILGSWFLPTPLTIALVAWLVFGRFTRRDVLAADAAPSDPATAQEIVRSVAGDHLGSVISEASVRVLPLLVVGLIGTVQNAYFYQAWLVATTLSLAASGMSHSFTAQAAADRASVAAYSRQILRHMFLILMPVAVVIGVGAPLVLEMFGSAYAAQAAPLLRLLALAVPFVIFDTWYLAYERVMGRIGRVVTLQAAGALVLIGLAYPLLRGFGITGLGVAWLFSRATIAIAGLAQAPAILRVKRAAGGDAEPSFGRLLEPNEARLVLPHVAEDAVRFVDARGATGTAPPDASGGLAVVPHPGRASMAAAYAALRPGGTCYAEWPAWRTGGAAGVARRCAAAGFETGSMYWPVGRKGHGRLLLRFPATERYAKAVRGLVAQRFPRPLGDAASRVAGLVMRTGLVPSLAVVARKPWAGAGSDEGSAPLPDLLVEGIRRVDPEHAADPTLVISTGAGTFNKKAHWLVFGGQDGTLRWVVKVPRHDHGSVAVRREIALLEHLAEREDLTSRLVVPRVGFTTDAPGFPVHVESALAGPRLDLATDMPYDVTAPLATDALVALAARREPSPRDEWWDRIVEPPLRRLETDLERLGGPDVAPRVREALSALGDLPLVCAHNDCAPWNAVLLGDRLGLFDWETGQERWLPAVDLTYFLANAAFCLDGTANTPEAVRSYRGLLDGSDPRGETFRTSLAAYASALGLRPEDVAPLRIAAWLFHSAEDLDNLLATPHESGPRVLSKSVCLPILLEELTALETTDAVIGASSEGGAARHA